MSGDRKHLPRGATPEPSKPVEQPAMPSRSLDGDRSWPLTDPMRYVRHERAEAVAQIHRSIQAWRKASGGPAPSAAIPQGGGAPLASSVRKSMEGQLGADLSQARVHTGGASAKAATDLGARAFTVNSDVHFGAGEFAPGTKEGDRLLAHELTHVVQGQKNGVQRKPTVEHAEEQHGLDVSRPEDAAEKEADAAGDRAADALHSKGAASGPSEKSSAAPAPISAKLQGSAVVHRAITGRRPPTTNAGRPVSPASTTSGDPKILAAEKFCAEHEGPLASFAPETAWNFSVLKTIEQGLRQLITSPEVAKSAKVLATQQLLKQKKAALEDYCVADMAKLGIELQKLDEHNARSYARAQTMGTGITRWQQQYANSIAGVRGWDAWTMARKRVDAVLDAMVANRDAALQKAISQIVAVKPDAAQAQDHVASAYDAVQAWLDPSAKMPDAAGLGAKVRDAYFDKKVAIVEAQQAKSKHTATPRPQATSPSPAGGHGARHTGATAAHPAPLSPTASASAPPVQLPVKPHTPSPAPTLPNHGLPATGHADGLHAPSATGTANSAVANHAAPAHPASKIAAAPAATAATAGKELPALDGTEGVAFEKLTRESLTHSGEDHETLRKEVLRAIEEQKARDPELGSLLEAIPIEQLMAVRGYTTQDYRAINPALRGYGGGRAMKDPALKIDPAELLKQIRPYISLAQVGLSKLPLHKGEEVYRSFCVDVGTERFVQWTTKGSVIKDDAFTSSSANPKIRMSANDNFKAIVKHKTGRKVHFLSAFENEQEVLFQPGTALEVLNVESTEQDGKKFYLVACKEV